MPKIKTNRASAKRYKVTAGKKLKRKKAYHKHIAGTKSTKRKRRLRKPTLVHKTELRRAKRLLGLA